MELVNLAKILIISLFLVTRLFLYLEPSKDKDSEQVQQILFNPNNKIMERIRRFEADMKKFGNPNNPKEKLNLIEIPSDMVINYSKSKIRVFHIKLDRSIKLF